MKSRLLLLPVLLCLVLTHSVADAAKDKDNHKDIAHDREQHLSMFRRFATWFIRGKLQEAVKNSTEKIQINVEQDINAFITSLDNVNNFCSFKTLTPTPEASSLSCLADDYHKPFYAKPVKRVLMEAFASAGTDVVAQINSALSKESDHEDNKMHAQEDKDKTDDKIAPESKFPYRTTRKPRLVRRNLNTTELRAKLKQLKINMKLDKLNLLKQIRHYVNDVATPLLQDVETNIIQKSIHSVFESAYVRFFELIEIPLLDKIDNRYSTWGSNIGVSRISYMKRKEETIKLQRNMLILLHEFLVKHVMSIQHQIQKKSMKSIKEALEEEMTLFVIKLYVMEDEASTDESATLFDGELESMNNVDGSDESYIEAMTHLTPPNTPHVSVPDRDALYESLSLHSLDTMGSPELPSGWRDLLTAGASPSKPLSPRHSQLKPRSSKNIDDAPSWTVAEAAGAHFLDNELPLTFSGGFYDVRANHHY